MRWITFDCYGTLLDWQAGFRRILEPVAGDRTDAVIRVFHETEPQVQAENPRASYKEILREALERASGGSVPGEVLIDGWEAISAFPDTVAALEALKRQGWSLGILTNCDEDLFAATRAALGVEPDLVITSEAVGSYKPALGHFERFEATTNVAREDWVHAAVSWWHDMVPARELGLRRIWVDRESSGHDASIVSARVPDMASLAAVLA
jgi:2-haloacid dehalogenase